jgi:hypothetical protein
MVVTNIVISFEMLEQGLGLPEGAKVIAVRESEQGNHLLVRVLSDNQPVDYHVGEGDNFSKLGEAFLPGAVSNVERFDERPTYPKDVKDFAEVDVIKAN